MPKGSVAQRITRPPGRKPRLNEAERSVIVGLVGVPAPGRLLALSDGSLGTGGPARQAHSTLDAPTVAAREHGLAVRPSQARRILLREGARWRRPGALATSTHPECSSTRVG